MEWSVPVELVGKLKDSYDKLYALRRKADYTEDIIGKEISFVLETYINILREAFSYVG